MDPLSDVLSSLKPQSYVARGFGFTGPIAVQFPRHTGIKCYALLTGDCWLIVETVPEPVHLTAGDCVLLPRGLPFCLSTDLSLTPVSYQTITEGRPAENLPTTDDPEYRYIAGGHFALQGEHAAMLLGGLPPSFTSAASPTGRPCAGRLSASAKNCWRPSQAATSSRNKSPT